MTKDYDSFLERMRSFDMDMSSPPEEEETGQNDEVKHFGIKGMKWGVRNPLRDDGRIVGSKYATTDSTNKKSSNKDSTNKKSSTKDTPKSKAKVETKDRSVTTKDGTTLTLSKDKTPALARAIAKLSPKVREEIAKTDNLTIKGPDGKTIGDMQLYREKKDSLNVVWVGINNSERGKGYATAAMNSAVKYAKKNNMKQVTLEVPGNSPDALHIYEKMGFKKGKVLSGDDDVWGGLTAMTLKLDEVKHYGIKGMKWGIRRPVGSDGLILPNSKTGLSKKERSKKDPDHELATKVRKTRPGKVASKFSEDEIKVATNRLRLENNVKRLAQQYSDPEGRQTARNISKVDSEKLAEVNKRLQNLDNLQNQVKQGKYASDILKQAVTEASMEAVSNYMIKGKQPPSEVVTNALSTVAASSIKQYYGKKSVENKALNVATQAYKQKK